MGLNGPGGIAAGHGAEGLRIAPGTRRLGFGGGHGQNDSNQDSQQRHPQEAQALALGGTQALLIGLGDRGRIRRPGFGAGTSGANAAGGFISHLHGAAANANFIARFNRGVGGNLLIVQVNAITAVKIVHEPGIIEIFELGVVARHLGVIQDDIIILFPPDADAGRYQLQFLAAVVTDCMD
jgi:hypothetical protein